jgi:hypothetical protein
MSNNIGRYSKRGPTRIKHLKIDSVDSVDRGAGEGVRVLLMKRDTSGNETGNNMSTILKSLSGGVHAAVERTVDLAKRNILNEHQVAEVQRAVAVAMFPTESSEGRSLAKLFATPIGMDLLAASAVARRPTFDEIQAEITKANATPDAKDGLTYGSDDDDDGENPFHAAIMALAADLAQTKQFAGKAPALIYDHIARNSQHGKKLLAAAGAWDLRRNATA